MFPAVAFKIAWFVMVLFFQRRTCLSWQLCTRRDSWLWWESHCIPLYTCMNALGAFTTNVIRYIIYNIVISPSYINLMNWDVMWCVLFFRRLHLGQNLREHWDFPLLHQSHCCFVLSVSHRPQADLYDPRYRVYKCTPEMIRWSVS